MNNAYMPFLSQIQKVIRHTDIEYTFRMHYVGEVKPGQFFEVSVPKYGEAHLCQRHWRGLCRSDHPESRQSDQ